MASSGSRDTSAAQPRPPRIVFIDLDANTDDEAEDRVESPLTGNTSVSCWTGELDELWEGSVASSDMELELDPSFVAQLIDGSPDFGPFDSSLGTVSNQSAEELKNRNQFLEETVGELRQRVDTLTEELQRLKDDHKDCSLSGNGSD